MRYFVYANTINNYTSERMERTEEFGDYKSALDYYRNTFSNQSEQLVDDGGEHTIMLYTKENDSVFVIKRHIIATTFNSIDND